jgi:hypothetical protein
VLPVLKLIAGYEKTRTGAGLSAGSRCEQRRGLGSLPCVILAISETLLGNTQKSDDRLMKKCVENILTKKAFFAPGPVDLDGRSFAGRINSKRPE